MRYNLKYFLNYLYLKMEIKTINNISNFVAFPSIEKNVTDILLN